MRTIRSGRWLLTAGLLAAAAAARAEDLVIQSFDGSGRLVFNTLSGATNYRIEWASSPAGPWTNSWENLASLPATSAHSVTCSVPMCYRVMALTDVSAGMVLIPAGSFVMGATTNMGHESYAGETPQHTVFVSAFFMDSNLVTKAKWDEVADWATTNGYDITAGSAGGKDWNHPAQSVSWYACIKWCNARSQKEGLTACYTNSNGTCYKSGAFNGGCNWQANGYRLPTEAEWEKAARGGVPGHQYPWSDSDEIEYARANYWGHPTYHKGGEPYTSPVGSFAPNGYGLYDMAGNALEWCWDWANLTYYSSSPDSDPRGPSSGTERMLRGGSWGAQGLGCRTAYRGYDAPGNSQNYVGFRAVRPR